MSEFIADVSHDGCKYQVVKWTGEIVRCKDCKHFQQMQADSMFCYYHGIELVGTEGYCSWGEEQ